MEKIKKKNSEDNPDGLIEITVSNNTVKDCFCCFPFLRKEKNSGPKRRKSWFELMRQLSKDERSSSKD